MSFRRSGRGICLWMGYFGWTREEARRFMRENTLESETRIATASLRYSTDLPGQAPGSIPAPEPSGGVGS